MMFRYLPRTVHLAPDTAPADPIERRITIRIAQGINRLFARNYHDMKVIAPAELPRTGPAILVSNHISGLDPLLIQSACRRLVIWMMAREYYDIRSIGWIFRMVEAIPVERSGRDTAATRAALRALHDGRVVGIFPEGRIETDHELLPFQTGVAMLAIKTGVPVYPVYLDGTQRGKNMVTAVLQAHRVQIAFGPAVSFDRTSTGKASLEAATEHIKSAVRALRSTISRDTI